ncbi:MAG: hypothetical protein EAZ86_15095 [Oscillatoriales cyanobacterium]|nr:MAG: hypothetical protein EAZ86_15095 [Oscillatoriales cyanobacterium]
MEYLIAAIVLGMLIWAGIEIVQTVRNWEPNQSEFNRKMQAEMGQYEANGFVADGATLGRKQSDTHSTPATVPPKPRVAKLLQVRSPMLLKAYRTCCTIKQGDRVKNIIVSWQLWKVD